MKVAGRVSDGLRWSLEKLGRSVARRPLPYLLGPLLLSTLLSYGFAFLNTLAGAQDALELYVPQTGLAKTARERIQAEFGTTYRAELDPISGFTFTVLLRAGNGSGVLTEKFVKDYLWLRSVLEGIRVKDARGRFYTYEALCWRTLSHDCVPDLFRLLTRRGIQGYLDARLLKFPQATLERGGREAPPLRLTLPLGGVRLSPQGFLRNAGQHLSEATLERGGREAPPLRLTLPLGGVRLSPQGFLRNAGQHLSEATLERGGRGAPPLRLTLPLGGVRLSPQGFLRNAGQHLSEATLERGGREAPPLRLTLPLGGVRLSPQGFLRSAGQHLSEATLERGGREAPPLRLTLPLGGVRLSPQGFLRNAGQHLSEATLERGGREAPPLRLTLPLGGVRLSPQGFLRNAGQHLSEATLERGGREAPPLRLTLPLGGVRLSPQGFLRNAGQHLSEATLERGGREAPPLRLTLPLGGVRLSPQGFLRNAGQHLSEATLERGGREAPPLRLTLPLSGVRLSPQGFLRNAGQHLSEAKLERGGREAPPLRLTLPLGGVRLSPQGFLRNAGQHLSEATLERGGREAPPLRLTLPLGGVRLSPQGFLRNAGQHLSEATLERGGREAPPLRLTLPLGGVRLSPQGFLRNAGQHLSEATLERGGREAPPLRLTLPLGGVRLSPQGFLRNAGQHLSEATLERGGREAPPLRLTLPLGGVRLSPQGFLRNAGQHLSEATLERGGREAPPLRLTLPLGGVRLSPQGFLRNADSALMNFHFPFHYAALVEVWETEFRRLLEAWDSPTAELSWFSMGQFQADLDSIAENLSGLMPYLGAVIIVFCMGGCCVADWVHSKPLLALAGVLSAGAAGVSGFGALLLLQVPLVDIVHIAPFLVLSIGVDDMFLMLAAWRRTNPSRSLEERMGAAFADAAVSISITSVTDVLSFLIGAFSVFPAVRYFCIYTAVCLAFTFLYSVTFFAACLAYSGAREAQNRHCLLFAKLPTSHELPKGTPFIRRLLWSGGDGRAEECSCPHAHPAISAKDNLLNLFFQRYYAPFLDLPAVQWGAAFSYVVYLCLGVWGLTKMEIGMNYAELLPDASTSSSFFHHMRHRFVHYTPPLEVLLPSEAGWESREVQRASLSLAASFRNTPFTYTPDFWLQDYLPYAAGRRAASPGRSRDFYALLGEFLLEPEFLRHAEHILFHRRSGRIRSTRFVVPVKGVPYGTERDFLELVKERLAASPLNATAHHPTFQLGEQQAAVLPTTLSTVGTATGAMLAVSGLLIPSALVSLSLAASIISTNLGVLGAMAWWGVRLDIVSMITVLMSIGISVDFVAHIAYFYVHARELHLPSHTKHQALRHLGLPILQGAMSTICGMLVLLGIEAYMIRAFVKTMLLVILFGLYHGLLLLPILLSRLLSPASPKGKHPAHKGVSLSSSGSESSCKLHPDTSPNPTLCTTVGSLGGKDQTLYAVPVKPAKKAPAKPPRRIGPVIRDFTLARRKIGDGADGSGSTLARRAEAAKAPVYEAAKGSLKGPAAVAPPKALVARAPSTAPTVKQSIPFNARIIARAHKSFIPGNVDAPTPHKRKPPPVAPKPKKKPPPPPPSAEELRNPKMAKVLSWLLENPTDLPAAEDRFSSLV